MKLFVIAATLLAATSLSPFTLASAQPAVGPEACQPLTSSNLEACCNAENWRDIVRAEDFAFCPPLNDNDRERLGEELAEDADDDLDDTDDTTTGSIDDDNDEGGGNPGNAADVGGAGEKGMDNEDPSTGTRGSSN